MQDKVIEYAVDSTLNSRCWILPQFTYTFIWKYYYYLSALSLPPPSLSLPLSRSLSPPLSCAHEQKAHMAYMHHAFSNSRGYQ